MASFKVLALDFSIADLAQNIFRSPLLEEDTV